VDAGPDGGHGVPSQETSGPAGLSASAITRLTEGWLEEYRRFAARDLSGADYVYVWVGGIHFGVRLDQDRGAPWW
jgi:hypothetical protein